jgi:hypothetical protein
LRRQLQLQLSGTGLPKIFHESSISKGAHERSNRRA